MTNIEETIEYINEIKYGITPDDEHRNKLIDALDMAIKALEKESETRQFAKWVATEIFYGMCEYNKGSFVEITCRKLAKLGIIRVKGNEWELVEESEDKK